MAKSKVTKAEMIDILCESVRLQAAKLNVKQLRALIKHHAILSK